MVLDIHTHNIDSAKKGEAIYNLTFEEEQAFPSLPPYLSLSLHPWDLTSNNLEPQLTWLRTKISDGRVVAIV